jgi:type II secretory ATPase GspE/PulE/Tfp pilus assembly ATPase PilB-like protein/8-oxo-dGTP pyrophosphatase MutT (NUDIX family)
MPKQATIRDDWLLPILKDILPANTIRDLTNAVDGSYWRTAVHLGIVTDEQILAAVAKRTRMQIAKDGLRPDPQARSCVPELLARRYGVLPLAASRHTLEVATDNPYDLDCEQTLAFVSGRRVTMALASPLQIAERIEEVYHTTPDVDALLATVQSTYDNVDRANTHDSPEPPTRPSDRPVIQLVDHIVSDGITRRASDIHLETKEQGITVRYRVDGVLQQVMVLPKGVGLPLVSRIKIMAGMDIANRLRPQGGRAHVQIDGTRIDLRVSTLPAAHGEKVVIRILDPSVTLRSLDTLGLTPGVAARLKKMLDAREGLILVTGPTGSGKTTTLYAALYQLLERGLNIITVEDPVEYRVPGIVQVQVNEKAGLTFAAALRSILRQDPDVILIGEVRDRETATIALQAALTGHLVFATLHTIDACSSIARLHDLGVEPTKIAAALKGVVAQRLVRKLCHACSAISADAVPPILWDAIPNGAGLPSPVGCPACSHTGYQGRLAVTELLTTTPDIERLIATTAPIGELVACARRSGMQSLWSSGVTHLLDGTTSAEELVRILEPDSHTTDRSAANQWDTHDDDPAVNVDEPLTKVTENNHYHSMTKIEPGVVDIYLVDPTTTPWHVLVLQRANDTVRHGSWETVHGKTDQNETPEQAAFREVKEETGLSIQRLYNVMVHAFYLHATTTIQLAVVFCAFVDSTQPVKLSGEHQLYEWMSIADAPSRFTWPRAEQVLKEIQKLLGTGSAGPVEDVLRIR